MIDECLVCWLSLCGWLFVYYAIYVLYSDITYLLRWCDNDLLMMFWWRS